MKLYREITPLTPNDCFIIFSRSRNEFNFPLHTHSEYELNLILNAAGAQRIIGDHVGKIDPIELVLVAPDLAHGWFNGEQETYDLQEITIQFDGDLFSGKFFQKNQMSTIRKMFENAHRGILFPQSLAEAIVPRIKALYKNTGFHAVSQFLSILYDLSLSTEMTLLADISFDQKSIKSDSRRIKNVFDYMNQHYCRQIKLSEVAAVAKMTEVAFSRFFKKHTGFSFIESLNDIRIGHISRLLIDTNQTIAEIAFHCGFNNIANFNRIFKRKKGMTPTEFRIMLKGKVMFL
ncbi:MAG: AraC family transcriptional regulator [Tannerella sp.]|jgi:AraC-like DNA-binding protein|nr:AraC family transcriptional regulator [Tannerella sp.]